ncbi:MAG: OB-fold domain-containing protein [Acidimicrobiales bacterium]
MRGILAAAGYVPRHRLGLAAVAETFGGTPAKGTRSVASYDEDTTTLGVEAARLARRGSPEVALGALWFSTAEPAYLDKTNATAIHAAVGLDPETPALDFGGALRSGVGALGAALGSSGPVFVVASGMRTGLPTSADEANGGDGAAALVVGSDDDGPLLAEHLATASVTAEFLDRWRTPGELRSQTWEERFGETQYLPLGGPAWKLALERAGLDAGDVSRVGVTGPHPRAAQALGRKLKAQGNPLAEVGYTGAASPLLLLASMLQTSAAGDVLALVSLADGADVLLFRVVAPVRPTRSIARQIESAVDVPYGRYLAWRGLVRLQPPNRPEPARPSAAAAARNVEHKFAFSPLADVPATVASFTVDRLVYSPSPPVVFAVLDFDNGDRFACELTDVDPASVAIGDRMEMTFRKLFSADGIHNYYWKARPA